VKTFLLCLLLAFPMLSVPAAYAQNDFQTEGLWEGYDGEWGHVSQQLIALANFYLLSVTGPKMPPDMTSENLEKTVTKKADVIDWLKRSLAAVKTARAQLKPGDLERKVKIEGKTVTVDGMYLRIIIHDNEHMGQLVAYARMNGIVPPWSKPSSKQ
jgi:hypothetical protein